LSCSFGAILDIAGQYGKKCSSVVPKNFDVAPNMQLQTVFHRRVKYKIETKN